MSIWCSRPHIGYDPYPDEPQPAGGQVRSYATGWSNHYPTTDGTVEQPASIDTAHIAPWCVPGHERRSESATLDDESVGPWLRLAVDTAVHNPRNPSTVTGHTSAEVVLDEAAVRALVDDLTDWLNTPKVHPATPGDEARAAAVRELEDALDLARQRLATSPDPEKAP